MDTMFKILAILGALAWLPQLIKWIVDRSQKPKLSLFFEKEAQVGYITVGSVFNINLSFLAKQKHALVDNIILEIKDKDGAIFNFAWDWYSETYYEMKAPVGSAIMSKQQTAIAINAYRDILIEKLVGFQLENFKEKRKPLIYKINEAVENQKQSQNINEDAIKQNKDYNDLMRLYDNSMIWKVGSYTAICKVFIAERAKPFISKFNFSLSELEIANLKNNINLAKQLIEYSYFSKPGEVQTGGWLWASPKINITKNDTI